MKNRNIISEFEITKEDKKKLIEEIQYYFEQEREEKIGIIAAEKILEFFLEILGKRIYNKTLDDTKKWFNKSLNDLESDFYALYKS